MRLLLLVPLLMCPVAAASAPPVGAKSPEARCPNDILRYTHSQAGARPRNLAELPPAQLYMSVDRQVAGCREPLIVRYRVGEADGARRRSGR